MFAHGGGYGGPVGCGVGGYGCGPGPVAYDRRCEPERESYGGSTFVLIVVLFILLIIVGKSFC